VSVSLDEVRTRHLVGVASAFGLLLIGFAWTMAAQSQSARIAAERDRSVAAEQRARTEAAVPFTEQITGHRKADGGGGIPKDIRLSNR
jgi:hypothetical protein